MQLPEFLLARIAEDEAVAQAQAKANRSDPERFWPRRLADCDAKRLIVAEHEHALARRGCCDEHDTVIEFMDCNVCAGVGPDERERGGWCRTLRLLAVPYADHPDYRGEWKP